MTLLLNGEEIVLFNSLRGGKDAHSFVYAVPKEWAEKHNLKQYDWDDFDSVPRELYDEITSFPTIEDALTRVWEY